MKTETYDIVLHSPIGPKRGTMTLFFDGGAHFAQLQLMKFINRFSLCVCNPGEYRLSGIIKTLAGAVTAQIDAQIKDGILSAVAETSKGVMLLDGMLTDSTISDTGEVLADASDRHERKV